MVRLRTEYYESDNLTFKYSVNIDKEGNFTTTIPQDIVDKLLTVGIELKRNKMKNDGFFSEKSLIDLKESVKNIADKFSKKELIEEKIILRYSVNTSCSYCKGKDGIYPNGQWQTEKEGGNNYNWINGTKETNATNCKPFGFEIFVEVKKVKIWKFLNGEIKKEYDNLRDIDIKEDKTLDWINSLCGIGKGFYDSIKEIDYTDELGILFKNMVMYIFNINENILQTFGKEFDLSKVDIKTLSKLGFSGSEGKN